MGVTAAQGLVDCGEDAFGIAEHIVIPEAKHAIAFGFDQAGAGSVGCVIVLPAVAFDDQTGPMACEVGDKMPQWHLPPEAGVGEGFTQ